MAPKNEKVVFRKLEKLRETIEQYNFAYYVLDDPVASDSEYDRLMRQLEALEEKYPNFSVLNSPSQRVGVRPIREFKEVRHGLPMLSLENALSKTELANWLDRRVKRPLKAVEIAGTDIDFAAEPKLDGAAVSVRYEKGLLVLG